MPAVLYRRLAVGLLGSVLVAPVALGQQTGGGGTGTSQNQTGTNGTGTGGGSTTSPGSTSTPGGMALPELNFNEGRTTTGTSTGGGATSRNGRGTGRTGSTQRVGTTQLGGNLGGAGRTGTTGIQNNRQPERRAQYVTRIGFAPASNEPAATVEVRSAVEQSLAAIVPTGTTVTMDGSTAVLAGTVPSLHERKLAERMALLEPGVRSVRNELVVAGNL